MLVQRIARVYNFIAPFRNTMTSILKQHVRVCVWGGGTFPAITRFLMQACNDAIQVQAKKIKVVTVSGILLDHWMIMTEGFPVDLCP